MTKRETPKEMEKRIMIGSWLAGVELQHLQNINASDFEGDTAALVSKIKGCYHGGIKNGTPIMHTTKGLLVDELEKIGFEKRDIYEMAEEAKGMEIAYMQAVAKLYEVKARALLAGIDYSKPGAQTQAKNIIEKYTIEGVQGLKAPACDAIARLKARMEDPQQRKVIPAGTPMMTRLSGGLRPQDLTVVAGRPGAGKSTYCMQIALDAVQNNFKVMFLPLEMSAEAVAGRMVQSIAYGNVTSDMIRGTVETTAEQKKQLYDAMQTVNSILNSGQFIMLEGERDLAAIEQQVAIYHPDILIIDQLSQLTDSRQSFRNDQIRYRFSHLTQSLKALAMETGVSIVLAAQQSRKAEELKDGKPTNGLFKESGSIEEDADRCFQLIGHEHDEFGIGKPVDIWCTKNRDYRANFVVYTHFVESRMRFYETEDN